MVDVWSSVLFFTAVAVLNGQVSDGELLADDNHHIDQKSNSSRVATFSSPFSEENKDGYRYKKRECAIQMFLTNTDLLLDAFIIFDVVDRFLRQVDFDQDGSEDNFGIYLQNVTIDNSMMETDTEDFRKFYKSCSSMPREENICLVVCFTSSEQTNGLVANGGRICSSEDNRNTIALNTHPKFGNITLSSLFEIMVSNFGAAFGACIPKVRFVQVDSGPSSSIPKAPKNMTTSFFSRCSREQIASALNEASCLVSKHSCGNGFLDVSIEQCDCGHGVCNESQTCCTDSCLYSIKGTICQYHVNECLESSVCSGNSEVCPPIRNKKNGTPCNNQSQTCNQGTCNSTVCMDNGFIDCDCENCQICCLQNEKCQPLSVLGVKSTIIHRQTGSSCFLSQGRCNSNGECILLEQVDLGRRFILWITCNWALLTVVGLIFLAILCILHLCRSRF